ncbi:hypothetical protein HII36_48380 [Nonomuraea sp. NN258]|uniref:hypothetical protein n=1 Tax=Nonomuraea antri TaxID=2730852 RepID=UPI00156A2413|nr:hypothetical protein [Nonomuraea antri]NRQ39597.1 hypothetical protein [Nonomuraea antri]
MLRDHFLDLLDELRRSAVTELPAEARARLPGELDALGAAVAGRPCEAGVPAAALVRQLFRPYTAAYVEAARVTLRHLAVVGSTGEYMAGLELFSRIAAFEPPPGDR